MGQEQFSGPEYFTEFDPEKFIRDMELPREKVNPNGGAIALDAKGRVAFPFNTEGMYRGWIGADGVPHVAIYAGVPRANHAIKIAKETFAEMEAAR